MITIENLTTSEQIEQACELLYERYILQLKWHFAADNHAQTRVEKRGIKNLLVDKSTDRAIWFGAFDNEKLIGCIRLTSMDESGQLDVEKYPSSQPIQIYLENVDKARCYEMQKGAVKSGYAEQGIFKRLVLTCLRYCQEQRYHVLTFTNHGYIKTLFQKIEFPLIKEQAFRYEEHDSFAVNFYFADVDNSKIDNVISRLEDLDINPSNKAIFKALEMVEPILPTPFYWMSTEGVVLGINDLCLRVMNRTHSIIGKKPYDFYTQEIAEHILNHNAEVIRREEILAQEEWLEDENKNKRYFSSIKAPLYNDDGVIIGIVGTSIETTAQKEAEALRIELKANEQFSMLARKVAHDLSSPLAVLQTVMTRCSELSPEKQALLKNAAESILAISNDLIRNYHKNDDTPFEHEPRINIDVVEQLKNIVADKSMQYENNPVSIKLVVQDGISTALISVQLTEFKRALSNLINNAVDALEEKQNGLITVKLLVTDSEVAVEIVDNGKGMSSDKVDKMLARKAFTAGKEHGHGLGLQQIWDMLEFNEGKFNVQSIINVGTTVHITFPRLITAISS